MAKRIADSSAEARRLASLFEISQALSGRGELKPSLQRVLEKLERDQGLIRGAVMLLSEETREIHIESSLGFGPEGQEEELARLFGVRVLRSPLDDVRRELDEYFDGSRREFDLPLDLRVAAFHEEVLRELAQVPYGITTTYGALAGKVGRPGAARAVGTVMNRNPIPIVLPCHRVVGASGALTGYAGGLERKRVLLSLEGATLA